MKKLLLSLLLLTIPSVALAAGDWVGDWKYAGGEAQIEAMQKQVEAVTSEMGFLIRGIARSRLRDECQPYDGIEIWQTDDEISVRTDLGVLASPLGEKVQRRGHDGADLTVHRRLKGDVLIETIASDRGGRTNRYRVEGETLRVRSAIFSPRLPRPVEFTYTYRR